MSRQKSRSRSADRDAIAVVRSDMERAEAQRLRALKLAIGFAAITLVVAAVLAVSMVGPGASRAAEAATDPAPVAATRADPEPQRLDVAIGVAGYEPSVLSAKAGIPIELTVAQGDGCAAGLLIPALGVEMDNSTAAATRNLGALAPGDYRFTCGMQMVEGVLTVR